MAIIYFIKITKEIKNLIIIKYFVIQLAFCYNLKVKMIYFNNKRNKIKIKIYYYSKKIAFEPYASSIYASNSRIERFEKFIIKKT